MLHTDTFIDEWSSSSLVDPRGTVLVQEKPNKVAKTDAWPITWSHRRVGLFSNKKPNADAMLEEVQRGLADAAPDLTFVYGSKEPLAEKAEPEVIERLRDCDVVVLASAECGGCTSWVCQDYITLEKMGVPCMLIATDRFEGLARSVLTRGGITKPHLAIPRHPVSGITGEQAQDKIRERMAGVIADILGGNVHKADKAVKTA